MGFPGAVISLRAMDVFSTDLDLTPPLTPRGRRAFAARVRNYIEQKTRARNPVSYAR